MRSVAVVPPPLPPMRAGAPSQGRVPLVLIVLMWLAWLGVMAVADLLGLLMFAFADSPGSARSAQAMVGPVFVWLGVTFVAGAVLLALRRSWWQVLLAFGLAASPPFVVFAGYNALAGASGGGGANVNAGPPPPPPQRMTVPPGGFRPPPPPPRQTDFRAILDEITPRPTTRPGDDERPPRR